MPKKQFSEMSKSEKLKTRKEAYKRWAVKGDSSQRRLTKIALDLGMTREEIQYYKDKDLWWERYDSENKKAKKEVHEENKKIVKNNDLFKDSINKIDDILESAGIPEKWQLFIMHYLKSFNGKHAAQASGYGSSNSVPFNILQDERVKKAVKEIRLVMHEDIYVSAHDILKEYIKIAFADMTDFLQFDGTKVTLKDSTQVDGRLITEVKQGRDGITIKLADKMKAMDRLEKLFDVIPDRRLDLEKEKFELNKKIVEKESSAGNKVVIINDL